MIIDEQKMVYILTKPELRNWSNEVWGEMWEYYLEWCTETAELNNEIVDVIMEDFDFITWYRDWLEDQTAVNEMLRQRGIL